MEDTQSAQDGFRTQLERGGEDIQVLTAALNNRIQKLESWLAALPGRVETVATIAYPDDPENYKFSLRLKRSTWALQYRYFRKISTSTDKPEWSALDEWRAVKSASLDVKMATVEAIPALLESMQKAQEELLGQLRDANAKFDRVADAVGLPHEEGA